MELSHKNLKVLRVFASTIENFAAKLTKPSLPVMTNEIGDTWIQGVASDPRKMSLYRAAIRALKCEPPKCTWEWDLVKDFALFLVKIPEHTWGLPGANDERNLASEQLESTTTW